MTRPSDTRSSLPSQPARDRVAAGADAAVLTQRQCVVDVLEDAARACDARADLPATDRWIWSFEGETVRSAADQLRLAAPAGLPVSFPT